MKKIVFQNFGLTVENFFTPGDFENRNRAAQKFLNVENPKFFENRNFGKAIFWRFLKGKKSLFCSKVCFTAIKKRSKKRHFFNEKL